jgi:GNAT superfamily N-acetyltransferase
MTYAVHVATAADIPSWLELVREVEPLFGPMPMFDLTVRNKIKHGDSLCVRAESGDVIGGLLLGGSAPDYWIRWLAVRRSARKQGAGSALMDAALDRFTAPCTISLSTFGADNVEGRAARRLYQRFRFSAREMLPPGPEGGTRQLFTLVQS